MLVCNLHTLGYLSVFRSWCPDRTLAQARKYIADAMGKRYADAVILDLEETWNESDPQTPLVCFLSMGSDPTNAIEGLAKKLKLDCRSISMGQGQEVHARRLLSQCMAEVSCTIHTYTYHHYTTYTTIHTYTTTTPPIPLYHYTYLYHHYTTIPLYIPIPPLHHLYHYTTIHTYTTTIPLYHYTYLYHHYTTIPLYIPIPPLHHYYTTYTTIHTTSTGIFYIARYMQVLYLLCTLTALLIYTYLALFLYFRM